MTTRILLVAVLAGLATALNGYADTVTLTSGRDMECIVLQENADSIVVRRGYGTMTIPRESITKVTKSATITAPAEATATASQQRMPAWSQIVGHVVAQAWAKNLQQIPATVIDKGVMRSVPYQSYRCSDDYEINIYGDPDAPAAIEIGIYRGLLKNATAKENCVQLMSAVLGDRVDAQLVRVLARDRDMVVRRGLTFEVTPPTANDAYGGWWISVYDEAMLDKARASETEMREIAVPVASASSPAPKLAAVSPAPVATTPKQEPPRDSADAASTQWTSQDMRYARPTASDGGRVYVRGYYRKNGTYVHSYTRRR